MTQFSAYQRRKTTDLSSLYKTDTSVSTEPVSETVTIRLKKTNSTDISDQPKKVEDENPQITVDEAASSSNNETPVKKRVKKKKLLIQEVKEVMPPDAGQANDLTSGEADSSADVSFIIQVSNSGE